MMALEGLLLESRNCVVVSKTGSSSESDPDDKCPDNSLDATPGVKLKVCTDLRDSCTDSDMDIPTSSFLGAVVLLVIIRGVLINRTTFFFRLRNMLLSLGLQSVRTIYGKIRVRERYLESHKMKNKI